jgi:non-homologous end joining protein Ku
MAINYFTANPDVAEAYQSNSYGLSPQEFADAHYNLYGQAEQRAAPTSLANVISTIAK